MIWHMNYDFLVGFDAKTLEPRPEFATNWDVSPTARCGRSLSAAARRGQDGVPVTAKDVAFTFNYINKNQLLTVGVHRRHHQGGAVNDTTVLIHTKAPKANMLQHGRPDPARAHLGQAQRQGGGHSYQNAPPIVGDGPFQIVEWQQGNFVRMKANPTTGAASPRSTRSSSSSTRTPTRWPRTSSSGPSMAPSTCRRAVQATGTEPGLTTNRHVLAVHRARHELLRQPELAGQPGAQGPAFRQARELGGRPREDRRASR